MYVFRVKKTGYHQNGGIRDLERLYMACVSGDIRAIEVVSTSAAPQPDFTTSLNMIIREALRQEDDIASTITQDEIDTIITNIMRALPEEELIIVVAKFGGLSFTSGEYIPAYKLSGLPELTVKTLPGIQYSRRSIETLARHNSLVSGLSSNYEVILNGRIIPYIDSNLGSIVERIMTLLMGVNIMLTAEAIAASIKAIMEYPGVNVIGVPFGPSEAMIQGISRYWINALARHRTLSGSDNAESTAAGLMNILTGPRVEFVHDDIRRFSTSGSGIDVMETLICGFTLKEFIICACCIRITCNVVFTEFISFLNGGTGELPPICDPNSEKAFWRDGLRQHDWDRISAYLKQAPAAVAEYRASHKVDISHVEVERKRRKELEQQKRLERHRRQVDSLMDELMRSKRVGKKRL